MHCDRGGRYSLHSSGVTDQNHLRGIQATDSTGTVTFSSVYPGRYAGRWPHIHFEVCSSLANATSGRGPIVKTSQIALPRATSSAVYATAGYSQSGTGLSRITLSAGSGGRRSPGEATRRAGDSGARSGPPREES